MNIVEIYVCLNKLNLQISTKYISLEDLEIIIKIFDITTKLTIEARDFIKSGNYPSLDVIYPAMDHLKSLLEEQDK